MTFNLLQLRYIAMALASVLEENEDYMTEDAKLICKRMLLDIEKHTHDGVPL